MSENYKSLAHQVINLEIEALKKLKRSININFEKAINAITNCNSKIILCGVGKSGLIASKIASTLSSVGCPAFSLSANDCLHGDLGSISKNDLLILISNSGNSEELSPTSSTSMQLAIGDALAVASLNKKKFSKYDFSKFHPGGNLGKQLKTVEDLMVTRKKIPFINENKNLKDALKTITQKKLGVLIAKSKKNKTSGILTDGNIRKLRQKNYEFNKTLIKKVMTKNPVTIPHDTLAVKALRIMNDKKITSLCVHKKNKMNTTIGLIHIHHLLDANIE